MASEPQDRENLLRDATAYTSRIQLKTVRGEEVVFAGFRSSGAASFFFNQDPVYHFNATGALRRAFAEGHILKAENGRLVRLHRQRTDDEVAMIREELNNEEQETLCRVISQNLSDLRQTLLTSAYAIEGEFPADKAESPLKQVIRFLEELAEIKIADSPGLAG